MGIYVLGMHRSGTSAVAGAISALCQLPAGRLAVASNPRGQWERPELRPATELILTRNRVTWSAPPPESTALQVDGPLRAYASRVFARHCAGPFLWKDPRLCLTIDHWTSLPQDEPRMVYVHRSPAAVADSLRRRNGWPVERGLALWERTNRNAITRIGGREVFVVDYDSLRDEPEAVIDRMGQWLGCPDDPDRANALADAATTIEPATIDPDSIEPDSSSGNLGDAAQEVTLTVAQGALAERLRRSSGPTRLDLDEIGPESATTGPALGNPTVNELARRAARAIRAMPSRHHLEIAGRSGPPR